MCLVIFYNNIKVNVRLLTHESLSCYLRFNLLIFFMILFSGFKMIVGNVLTVLAAAFVSYCNGDPESCLRFGGGGCCPVVNPTTRTLQQVRS